MPHISIDRKCEPRGVISHWARGGRSRMSDLNGIRALRVSPFVRACETQDGAVLLDIRQGICFSMTPVAIRIWHMVEQDYSLEETTSRLAAEFQNVPRQQLHADVQECVVDLEQKGLMVKGNPESRIGFAERLLAAVQSNKKGRQKTTSRKNNAPRILMLKALLGLLAFDLLRFGSSFTRTHAFVRSWTAAPGIAAPEVVDLVCKAVNYACVWYPKRVLCLQRSAVTTCLLRSCSIQAQMVIGAQKLPFKAHAWTEVESQAINERRNVKSIYMVWERC